MSKITIIKTSDIPTESLKQVRDFLFCVIDGFTAEDKLKWRRFWQRITRAEAGELFNIEAVSPRNSKFHRKFFALLTVGFDAWEPDRKKYSYRGNPIEKNFEHFREQILILAGYYTQVFSLTGKMELVADSIKFSEMDNDDFETLYQSVVTVLLGRILTNYAGRAELDPVVEQIMRFA